MSSLWIGRVTSHEICNLLKQIIWITHALRAVIVQLCGGVSEGGFIPQALFFSLDITTSVIFCVQKSVSLSHLCSSPRRDYRYKQKRRRVLGKRSRRQFQNFLNTLYKLVCFKHTSTLNSNINDNKSRCKVLQNSKRKHFKRSDLFNKNVLW